MIDPATGYDLTGVPCTHETHWYKCNECDHLHVLCVDDNDEPIATMILSREMIESMLQVLDEKVTH